MGEKRFRIVFLKPQAKPAEFFLVMSNDLKSKKSNYSF